MKWKLQLKKATMGGGYDSPEHFKTLVGKAKNLSKAYDELSELILDLSHDMEELDRPEQIYSEIRELWQTIHFQNDALDLELERIQELLGGL